MDAGSLGNNMKEGKFKGTVRSGKSSGAKDGDRDTEGVTKDETMASL